MELVCVLKKRRAVFVFFQLWIDNLTLQHINNSITPIRFCHLEKYIINLSDCLPYVLVYAVKRRDGCTAFCEGRHQSSDRNRCGRRILRFDVGCSQTGQITTLMPYSHVWSKFILQTIVASRVKEIESRSSSSADSPPYRSLTYAEAFHLATVGNPS